MVKGSKDTAKPLGLAIVGLGMAHKPHVEALRNLAAEVRILHCHAPSPERRKSFGEKHPDLPITEHLQSILDDREVDVVLILTPPFSHRELVLACAAAGKHVLLEKPLDVSTARAWDSVRSHRAPQCSGRDAVRVLGLIEAMLESSASAQSVAVPAQ